MDASRAELTPLRFLERAAAVFPDKLAIVDGDRRLSYREFAGQATRVARALMAAGVRPGERVAYLCANTTELLVAHFAVPLAGGVLVAVNTRLSSPEVEYICEHAEARVLVVDAASAPLADRLSSTTTIVGVGDLSAVAFPVTPYEQFLATGSDEPLPWTIADEDATIAINYTSGTTGRPKGVMCTHRGAYLNALGEVVHSHLQHDSVYLWTLPMFHCNGWCTTWGVTAMAARHVCLRAVRTDVIWALLRQEGVTHLSGAPIVLSTLADGAGGDPLAVGLTVTTAGAPPSPTVIARLEQLDMRVIHVYGLTEAYGPYSVCEPQDHWQELEAGARARLMARQGVGMLQAQPLRVVDEQMGDVPADGVSMGEIVMRGNNVMKGYFKDPEATAAAFRGGWFHTGDLGVMHADGYVELLDRAKDIVISGGENVSTVEVEQTLLQHAAVADAAVVGVPDPKWGEVPKAFVVLRAGADVDEAALIAFARERTAHFKAPKAIAFVDALPRTSTGKVQKYELREREWTGRDTRIQG